ncbi:MAG: polysaccharide deacetylase family protein [Bacteroidota bacterium]
MILPGILSKVSKNLVWNFKGEEKKIYLTFDDGPTEDLTDWILETLERYHAKATFFCLGKNVERFKDQYQKILNSGHAVGNHSFSHLKGWSTKNKKYFRDIEKAGELINSDLFRPPHGKIRLSQIKHLKADYKIVLWDVLSKDYNTNISPEKIIQRVIRLSRPGSVVVFHDSKQAEKNLKQVLPVILEYYQNRGCTFSSIPYKQS